MSGQTDQQVAVNGFVSRRIFTAGKTFIVKKADTDVTDYDEFEEKLELLARTAEELNLRVDNGLNDGRLVSHANEHLVANRLLDTYSWVIGKSFNRDHGDVYIKTKHGLFPVNIKLIRNNTKSCNNICGLTSNVSKLLYGETCTSKMQFAKLIKESDFTTDVQQYGILAVNKTTGQAKWATLFNINELAVNPTNGLQFSFKNMEATARTQREGQEFLLAKVLEFFKKQAEPFMYINE